MVCKTQAPKETRIDEMRTPREAMLISFDHTSISDNEEMEAMLLLLGCCIAVLLFAECFQKFYGRKPHGTTLEAVELRYSLVQVRVQASDVCLFLQVFPNKEAVKKSAKRLRIFASLRPSHKLPRSGSACIGRGAA